MLNCYCFFVSGHNIGGSPKIAHEQAKFNSTVGFVRAEVLPLIQTLISGDEGVMRIPLVFIGEKSVGLYFLKLLYTIFSTLFTLFTKSVN